MEICIINAAYLSQICLILASYMKQVWLWRRLNDTDIFYFSKLCMTIYWHQNDLLKLEQLTMHLSNLGTFPGCHNCSWIMKAPSLLHDCMPTSRHLPWTVATMHFTNLHSPQCAVQQCSSALFITSSHSSPGLCTRLKVSPRPQSLTASWPWPVLSSESEWTKVGKTQAIIDNRALTTKKVAEKH